MKNASLAIRRKHVARAAGTRAVYSWGQRNFYPRTVHAGVHKSVAATGSRDANCYRRLLNVLVEPIQMMFARIDQELHSVLSDRLCRKAFTDALKDIEFVDIAIHPGDI